MGSDCRTMISRWILSMSNSIIVVSSFVLLALSIFMLNLPQIFIDGVVATLRHPAFQVTENADAAIHSFLTPSLVVEIGTLLLIFSMCILVPSGLGYIGAVRQNRILLILYLVCLFVGLVVQLVIVTVVPLVPGQLKKLVSEVALTSLDKFYNDRQAPNLATLGWNFLMAELSCCGFHNFTDFVGSRSFQLGRAPQQKVPESCCILNKQLYPAKFQPEDTDCLTVPTIYNSYFLKGCFPALEKVLISHINPVMLSVIGLVSLEVILMTVAVCLCVSVHSNKTNSGQDRETFSKTVRICDKNNTFYTTSRIHDGAL